MGTRFPSPRLWSGHFNQSDMKEVLDNRKSANRLPVDFNYPATQGTQASDAPRPKKLQDGSQPGGNFWSWVFHAIKDTRRLGTLGGKRFPC